MDRKEIKCYNFILLKNIFLEITRREIIFIYVESILLNILKTKLYNISLNILFKYNSTIKKQENYENKLRFHSVIPLKYENEK